MKRRGHKFWQAIALSFAAWLIICVAFAVWFKTQLSPEAHTFLLGLLKAHFGPLLILSVLLFLVGALFLDNVLRKYIRPLRKITEQISLVNPTNPSHRFEIEGAAEIQQLCDRLNEGAAHYESLLNGIEGHVNLARAQSEEEKSILAAIMSELPEGVIVCNPEGQILLYNNRAKLLLSVTGTDSVDSPMRYIGLGRSIFGIIDGTYLHLFANCVELGMQFVTPRHETTAAHMAGAYARMTGKLGVCIASNGPGVANVLPGVAVEEAEGNRVLLLTSSRRTGIANPDRGGTYQCFDQTSVIRPMCKWSQAVPSALQVWVPAFPFSQVQSLASPGSHSPAHSQSPQALPSTRQVRVPAVPLSQVQSSV